MFGIVSKGVSKMQNACHICGGKPEKRYQLRHAAGLYWLIDMEQPDKSYHGPVPLNEGGARLWRMIDGGASLDEICQRLCAESGISMERARADADDFIQQLQNLHVDLGGLK